MLLYTSIDLSHCAFILAIYSSSVVPDGTFSFHFLSNASGGFKYSSFTFTLDSYSGSAPAAATLLDDAAGAAALLDDAPRVGGGDGGGGFGGVLGKKKSQP